MKSIVPGPSISAKRRQRRPPFAWALLLLALFIPAYAWTDFGPCVFLALRDEQKPPADQEELGPLTRRFLTAAAIHVGIGALPIIPFALIKSFFQEKLKNSHDAELTAMAQNELDLSHQLEPLPLEESVAYAQDQLSAWKAGRRPLPLQSDWLVESELGPTSSAMDRAAAYQALARQHMLAEGFRRILNGHALDLTRLEDIRDLLFAAGLDQYRDDSRRLIDLDRTGALNCSGETKLILSALLDSGVRMPAGWKLGVQVYLTHVQVVILDSNKHEVIEVLSGQIKSRVEAPIYDPAIAELAYLGEVTDGKNLPLDEHDLLVKAADPLPPVEAIRSSIYRMFIPANGRPEGDWKWPVTAGFYNPDHFPPERAVLKHIRIHHAAKNDSIYAPTSHVNQPKTRSITEALEKIPVMVCQPGKIFSASNCPCPVNERIPFHVYFPGDPEGNEVALPRGLAFYRQADSVHFLALHDGKARLDYLRILAEQSLHTISDAPEFPQARQQLAHMKVYVGALVKDQAAPPAFSHLLDEVNLAKNFDALDPKARELEEDPVTQEIQKSCGDLWPDVSSAGKDWLVWWNHLSSEQQDATANSAVLVSDCASSKAGTLLSNIPESWLTLLRTATNPNITQIVDNHSDRKKMERQLQAYEHSDPECLHQPPVVLWIVTPGKAPPPVHPICETPWDSQGEKSKTAADSRADAAERARPVLLTWDSYLNFYKGVKLLKDAVNSHLTIGLQQAREAANLYVAYLRPFDSAKKLENEVAKNKSDDLFEVETLRNAMTLMGKEEYERQLPEGPKTRLACHGLDIIVPNAWVHHYMSQPADFMCRVSSTPGS